MKMRLTRIRLLAGLALFGLPVASAAQDDQYRTAADEQAPTIVHCTRSAALDPSGVEANFSASFRIEDGVLRSQPDASPTASAKVLPGRMTLGDGVTLSRVNSMTGDADQAIEPPQMLVEASFVGGLERKIDLTSYFDQGVEVEPVTLRVMRGRTTLATIESIGVSANVGEDGDRTFRVDYQFGTDDTRRWFRAPVTIELSQRNRLLARMDFDARLPSLEPFLTSQLEMLEGRPANPEALPEGCTLGGGCFLTTATVSAIGLADDCWELRTLRRFRDGLLSAGGAEAKRMIAEYYHQAPLTAALIGRRSDAQRIWLRTYWFGILPAAITAQLGNRRVALAIYVHWTRKLGALAAAVR